MTGKSHKERIIWEIIYEMAGKPHTDHRGISHRKKISELQSRDSRFACNLTWMSLNSRTWLKVDATKWCSKYFRTLFPNQPLCLCAMHGHGLSIHPLKLIECRKQLSEWYAKSVQNELQELCLLDESSLLWLPRLLENILSDMCLNGSRFVCLPRLL